MGEWVGALLFAVAVLAGARWAWWISRARVTWDWHCVYEIPLVDGRVYVGHARNPHKRGAWHRQKQRTLPPGHPGKWWPLVPQPWRDMTPFVMPDEWIKRWYRTKGIAEDVERERVRQHERRQPHSTANRIKFKGEAVAVGD
jgi:predicted GIY-YIG superfamily endonuclease